MYLSMILFNKFIKFDKIRAKYRSCKNGNGIKMEIGYTHARTHIYMQYNIMNTYIDVCASNSHFHCFL